MFGKKKRGKSIFKTYQCVYAGPEYYERRNFTGMPLMPMPENQEKATGFCGECGSPIKKEDETCPKCGAKVN